MTHICVGNLANIGSDNGLSPGRRQAIIRSNAGILLIGPLGTNFSEIWIGIQTFSLKKIRLKMSSAKRRPFCLGLNVLNLNRRHGISLRWCYWLSMPLDDQWWRHQMEIFWPVNSPHKWPVTRSFDVFFDLRLNKRLSKQSWGWWFETLSRPLWRHCNVNSLTQYRLVTLWIFPYDSPWAAINCDTLGSKHIGCHFAYDILKYICIWTRKIGEVGS